MNPGFDFLRPPLSVRSLPLLLCGLLLLTGCGQADSPKAGTSPSQSRAPHPSDALFSGPVLQFSVEIAPAQLESLRREPRKSVPATLRSGSNVWESVGVRVKGAAGSTRSIDDLPALTLNVDKFKAGQKVHGLDKFHLNNSVQDPSRMSEIICADLYRRAGVPAARATHALVRLNGRDLGLYVLKEGFDKSFLNRNFTDASGNLYDGGFLRDIDQQLELDSGKEPPDWKDLQALNAACQIPDPGLRKAQLARMVDVDRFITYTALQVMTEDWDGYPCNRNNYRVYHEPTANRFVFLPHGMDQMFGQGGMSLDRGFEGIVASRIFQDAEWRTAYFNRIESLLTNVFTTNSILQTFDAATQRLGAALARLPRGEADSIRGSGRDLRRRIIDRTQNIQEQLASRPRPTRIATDGSIALSNWQSKNPTGDGGSGTQRDRSAGPEVIRMDLLQPGQPSLRLRLRLPPGAYHFEGRGRTKDLMAPQDPKGIGLGIRISGTTRSPGLSGTTEWQTLGFDFNLDGETEVELIAEVRGQKGSGWFDTGAFRLRRK